MTRWHGISSATGFVAHARATARVAVGLPMAFATSLIGARFAVRNRLQLPPDAPLKSRGADVERQVGVRRPRRAVVEQRAHLRAEKAIVPADLRVRILLPQFPLQRASSSPIITRHTPRAVAASSSRPERRLGDGEIDFCAPAAAPVCRRRHAQGRARAFVQPAARSVSRVVESRCHPIALAQRRLQLPEPAGFGKRARRNAHELGERPLKMKRARARRARPARFSVCRSSGLARMMSHAACTCENVVAVWRFCISIFMNPTINQRRAPIHPNLAQVICRNETDQIDYRFSQCAPKRPRAPRDGPPRFSARWPSCCVWAVTGPLFGYSNTWQLVINTGTTIITFLMVFLIQSTQNRDSEAMHLKLDELIRAMHGAHNALLDLEELEEKDLDKIRENYLTIAKSAREDIRKGRVRDWTDRLETG